MTINQTIWARIRRANSVDLTQLHLSGHISRPPRFTSLVVAATLATMSIAGDQAQAAVKPLTIFRFDTVDTTRSPIGTQLSFSPDGILFGALSDPTAASHPVFYTLTPHGQSSAQTWEFGPLYSEANRPKDGIWGIEPGCVPVSGAVYDPDPGVPSGTHYLGPFVAGIVACTSSYDPPQYGLDWSFWGEEYTPANMGFTDINAWGTGIPVAAKQPPGWQWWRGYGYAMSPPKTTGPTFGASWSGKDDYGQIIRIGTFGPFEPQNRSSRCGDLKVGSTKEHGFAPNYVSRDASNTLWFTTWATTTDSLPVHRYVSDGALWRIKVGKPCELVARFQNPMGHPNGVTPDGKGGAYVTTTGNAWVTNRGNGAIDYGGIWHWTPGDAHQLPSLTLLHRFSAAEGGSPMPALAADDNGDFWGITAGFKPGLPFPSPRIQPAQIFKLDASNVNISFQHKFSGKTEGNFAATQLASSSSGKIFGATTDAKSSYNSQGAGSVFNFAPQ